MRSEAAEANGNICTPHSACVVCFCLFVVLGLRTLFYLVYYLIGATFAIEHSNMFSLWEERTEKVLVVEADVV